MSETPSNTSRREFLKSTGRLAATSALVGGLASRMYAGENNTIQASAYRSVIGGGSHNINGTLASATLNVSNGTASAGVAVQGNYAYVADWLRGLDIIDISDPAA